MERRTKIAVFGAALAVLLGPPAHAQQPPSPAPVDDDATAKALFNESNLLYAEGRTEQAIEKLERAYELSARPVLLFNLANAYERLARYDLAAARLRRYLPDAPDNERAAVRKRIARLDERVIEQRAAEAARKCPTCAGGAAGSSGPNLRPAYALLGVSGGALVGGIVFGVLAKSAEGNADELCTNTPAGQFCPQTADGDIDRSKRYALLADISFVVSAAALAAGGYLYWRASNNSETPATTVGATATQNSVQLHVGHRF